jgi:energy-coupling factor transporter ATP-binding protein EcfA2
MENKYLNKTIGYNKYMHLLDLKIICDNFNKENPHLPQRCLTELEQTQIETYESKGKLKLSEEQKAKNKEYLDKVRGVYKEQKSIVNTTKGIDLNAKNLYWGFLKAFEVLNNKKYELTEDGILNLKTVIWYFAKDIKFFTAERLVNSVGDRLLSPNFSKGLLIVGDYGNGKTTLMNTFEYLIEHNYKIAISERWDNINQWKRIRFKIKACRDIASEYEYLKKDDSKQDFIEKYGRFNYCFDDITKEQIASNFGLKNVVQVVLENRYDDIFKKINNKKLPNKTHGTINYHKEYPNNLKIAIQSIGVKYEAHIYDRVLEMFNIIEFKGKSFRK